jgi:hypothetical protein
LHDEQTVDLFADFAGHLGGDAVRDSVADGDPHVHGVQDRLESRGNIPHMQRRSFPENFSCL